MHIKDINIVHKLHDVTDANVDVEITLDDGRVFSATFITPANIQTIMARYQSSGECENGLYFWASDMIVIKCLDPLSIETCIRSIVESEQTLAPFQLISVPPSKM
jgi:hypothetical protein